MPTDLPTPASPMNRRHWMLGTATGLLASGPVQPAWVAGSGTAAEPMPIFDAHLHYSHDTWERLPPQAAIALLRQAGLKRAMVSANSDQGTQILHQDAPDLILPSLSPDHMRGELGTWMHDDTVPAMREQHLAHCRYVAIGTRHATLEPRHFGYFRVPSLRQLTHTAPYMQDGSLATLDDVEQHYSNLPVERLHADGERILCKLNLSETQRADLAAFLRSLSR